MRVCVRVCVCVTADGFALRVRELPRARADWTRWGWGPPEVTPGEGTWGGQASETRTKLFAARINEVGTRKRACVHVFVRVCLCADSVVVPDQTVSSRKLH